MAELVLNGMLEEEVTRYYHICFFTDKQGPDPNREENYIFIPKVVCRFVDEMTVCIQDWYVYKKNLTRFIRYRSGHSYGRIQKRNPTKTAVRKEQFYNPKA
ncbi:MAG: hypothetical protein C4527_24345 [Candidatus Omnitrophota bacterium]|nr:MAG: hypothetical protein C4527_24345 [Candidatus Omnitrophota bacterium]